MGWVKFFLAENESHIYLNMCAKFGRGPTVVSKQMGCTDNGTLQLFIVDGEGGSGVHFGVFQRYIINVTK